MGGKEPASEDLIGEALTDEEISQQPSPSSQTGRLKANCRGPFIRGPFALGSFLLACRLNGRALAIWQLVHHQSRLRRKSEITLPAGLLAQAGITRWAEARALSSLERVGLISVRRAQGRAPRISLVELSEDEGA